MLNEGPSCKQIRKISIHRSESKPLRLSFKINALRYKYNICKCGKCLLQMHVTWFYFIMIFLNYIRKSCEMKKMQNKVFVVVSCGTYLLYNSHTSNFMCTIIWMNALVCVNLKPILPQKYSIQNLFLNLKSGKTNGTIWPQITCVQAFFLIIPNSADRLKFPVIVIFINSRNLCLVLVGKKEPITNYKTFNSLQTITMPSNAIHADRISLYLNVNKIKKAQSALWSLALTIMLPKWSFAFSRQHWLDWRCARCNKY